MVQRYIVPFLRRAASKQAVFLLSLSVIMLVSFRCIKTPTEPKAPTWPMDLTLPIIDRTYYFSELVAKDAKFDTTGGQIVYRPTNMQNEPTAIPIPTLNPVATSLSNKLGTLPLSVSGLPGIQLSMSQLLGQTPPQIPWAFGDVQVSQNISVMADTSSFDWANFNTARLVITLQNTMNVAVAFPAGIAIYNVYSSSDTNQVLATVFPPQLNAQSTITVPTSLSGKTMSSRLKLKFTMQTVGMNGKVLDPNGKIVASMGIDGGNTGTNASMQSAKVRIVDDFGMAKQEGSLQVLDDSIYISRAEFSKGGFDLKITNNVPVDIVAGLELKEVINKATGQPFKLMLNGTGPAQDSVIIPRNSTFTQPVNLANYVFISQTVSGGKTVPVNGVHYILTLKSLKATTDKRVISVDDDVSASLIPHANPAGPGYEPYAVSKFTGVVHPTTVSISETVDTKFGDVKDNFTAKSIDISNATIVMKLYSQTTYPVDLNMKITAWRNGVRGASMNLPAGNGGLNGSYRVLPGDTARVVFSNATMTNGTTLSQFLNSFLDQQTGQVSMPDKISLDGAATIQPVDTYNGGTNGVVGTATDHDSLYSSLEFAFPMQFSIQNGAFKDTVDMNTSDKESDKDKYDLIESGTVTFEVDNTFPVDAAVNLRLMKTQTDTDTLLNLTRTPLSVTSAQYNPSGANTPSKTYSTLSVVKGDAAKFKLAKFANVSATLQTGNNKQPVAFRTTDKIRIRAYGTFRLNVDFDKLKDNNSDSTGTKNNNPNNNNPNNQNPR